jgi:hypothetical protein
MKLYHLQPSASGFETQTLEIIDHNIGLNLDTLLEEFSSVSIRPATVR